jgi:hypothetical protein
MLSNPALLVPLQVGLLLYYTPLGMGKLGESWTAYSFIQAAGWVMQTHETVAQHDAWA